MKRGKRLRLSSPAAADLEDIFTFIAQDSQRAAMHVVQQIEDAMVSIACNPEMGVRRPELGPEVRGLVVGRYWVLYRAVDERVEVLRVYHHARQPIG